MIQNHGPEWLAEIDHIDDRDPDGYYIGSFDPSFVGCLPFDHLRRYSPKDELLGNGEEHE